MDWLGRLSQRPAVRAAAVPVVPAHPFHPVTLDLPTFVANDREMSLMVAGFLGGWIPILGTTWFLISKFSPHLRTQDRWVVMWFVLTGTIHTFFEGYYVLYHNHIGARQDLFAQLWKEYSLSDSRYMSADSIVVCAEAITVAVWGPLSYLTAVHIACGYSMRYPLQAIVSLGQLYGNVLYLSTSLVDLYVRGLSYSRPEPYYFWFYFIFLNGIWLVVPGLLLWQSCVMTSRAFAALARLERGLSKRAVNGSVKANGHAN